MDNVNQMLNKVIVGQKGNYKLIQQLGSGSISVVFKAERQEDSKIFAVKYVSSLTFDGQRKNRYQQNELDISKKIMEIKSKNLIEIFEVIQEDSKDFYIVMEFCDLCDLFSFSLTFWINWQTAIEFGYQIACGINDLHKVNITHRDLKPENIFVSSHKNDETQKIEYNIKIGDFGLSKEGDIFTSTVGTPNYMCPESYQEGDKTKETDIWAFGAILFELIEKKQYFSSHSAVLIYNQIKNFKTYDKQRLTKIDDSDVLDRVNNLIQKCLNFQPQNRIQSVELVQELQSILQSTKALPQEKRHISLKIPTNDFLKNQSYFQSIYYEIQDEDIHKNYEKQQFENKLNKQSLKKVESELVENSPDNSNENKNNYDSQNKKAEYQKQQSSNSIFYDESKQISLSNSKQNKSSDFYKIEKAELVFSKLLSNNSNKNTQEEPDQNQFSNGQQQIYNLLQRRSGENVNQNDDDEQINQSIRIHNKQLDNFEQSNLNSLNRMVNSCNEQSIYPIQEVRNSTYQSNQSDTPITSSYFNQTDTCQTIKQIYNGNDQIQQFYQNADFNEQIQKKEQLNGRQPDQKISSSEQEGNNVEYLKQQSLQQEWNDNNQKQQIYQNTGFEKIQKTEKFYGLHLNQNIAQNELQVFNFEQNGIFHNINANINNIQSHEVDENYLTFVELAIQILQMDDKNNYEIYNNNDSFNLFSSDYQIINEENELNVHVMFNLLRISLGLKKNNFYQELKNNEKYEFTIDKLFQSKKEPNDIFQLETILIKKIKILQYCKEYSDLRDKLFRYKHINKFCSTAKNDQKAKPEDNKIYYFLKNSKSVKFILY
ncbi:hypothetical protein ABPG72_008936 [Tetrahymena utriculariae]